MCARITGRIAEHTSVFAHLKQVQVLSMHRPLQLQHHLAAKANVFLGDVDGVPSQATPTPLFDAGSGVFELELRLVFLLLQLHEGAHMT